MINSSITGSRHADAQRPSGVFISLVYVMGSGGPGHFRHLSPERVSRDGVQSFPLRFPLSCGWQMSGADRRALWDAFPPAATYPESVPGGVGREAWGKARRHSEPLSSCFGTNVLAQLRQGDPTEAVLSLDHCAGSDSYRRSPKLKCGLPKASRTAGGCQGDSASAGGGGRRNQWVSARAGHRDAAEALRSPGA